MLFCGGKNTGKSSLLAMVASVLSTTYNYNVLVADFDPGQPVVGVERVLSLFPWSPHDCTRSMFDRSVRCIYYSGTTPKHDPVFYTQSLNELMSAASRDQPNYSARRVILINTTGWIKSLGLSVLESTVDITKPDLMVKIGKNLESLQPPEDNVMELDPNSNCREGNAKTARLQRYVDYYGEGKSKVYAVSLSCVQVVVDGDVIADEETIRRLLGGNINVGLVNEGGNCVGVGCVIRVDRHCVMYVKTPVEKATLLEVRRVVFGGGEGWVGEDFGQAIGDGGMRSRNNIPRKRLL